MGAGVHDYMHARMRTREQGRSSVVECRNCDLKAAGPIPGKSSGRIFFSRVSFFVLTLLSVPFPLLCYHSGMQKTLVILPKVQVTDYS